MTAVKVQGFCKRYGNHLVIDDISFEIPRNVICGILGVNGAGKTTLLECIEGLRPYQKGQITISDLSQPEALKQSIYGVQMQSASLMDVIKVQEVIQLFCDWNHKSNTEELLSLFDLRELAHQTYESLSTGQKRKLHLALAIVNDPDIVFLDEPTAGLDVEARASLHAMIRELKQQGKTIILSSHDMAEVESLCDQILFLKDGTIHFEGSVQEFRQQKVTEYHIDVKVEGQEEVDTYTIQSINDELPSILNQYVSKNRRIEDLQVHKPTLEDCFLDVARGESI